MESLVGYESDDGEGKFRKTHTNREHINKKSRSSPGPSGKRDNMDANLQNVNMDVSDESSSSSSSSSSSRSSRSRSPPRHENRSKVDDRRSEDKNKSSDRHKYQEKSRERSRSRDRDSSRFERKDRIYNNRADRGGQRNGRGGARHDNGNKFNRRNDRPQFNRRDEMNRNRNRDRDRYNDRERNRGRDRDRGNDRDRNRSDRDRAHRPNDDFATTSNKRKDNFGQRNSPPRKCADYDRYSRDRERTNGISNRRNDSPKRKDDNRSASPRSREPSRNQQNAATNSRSANSSGKNSNIDAQNRLSHYQNLDVLGRVQRRANEKVQQLQKMGIEIPNLTTNLLPFQGLKPQTDTNATATSLAMTPQTVAAAAAVAASLANDTGDGHLDLNNFTSPVLVNQKYTEQNQKKKLIWGSKKEKFEQQTKVAEVDVAAPIPNLTNNKWETAKFSHDSDGKMASKFLRLMGMKGETAAKVATGNSEDDESDSTVQKRQEMFSSMEQQYEVARQATHTMRGMGLGFGSQPRSF